MSCYFPESFLMPFLAGCVTRDRRQVERKKPGHLKARKMPTCKTQYLYYIMHTTNGDTQGSNVKGWSVGSTAILLYY